MTGTSLYQSGKLISLGLDPKTADLCWTNHCFGSILSSTRLEGSSPEEFRLRLGRFDKNYCGAFIEPAWSLEALIRIAPPVIEDCYFFTISGTDYGKYIVGYELESTEEEDQIALYTVTSDSLIDGMFDLVCWLLQHEKLTP